MSEDFDWTPHLWDGEEVLWQGRPDGRFRFFLQTQNIALIPIGLLFLAVGSIGVLGLLLSLVSLIVGGSVAPIEESFVMVLFFVVGGLISIVRPRVDQKRRQNRRYAVTTQRALVADHGNQQVVAATAITDDLYIDAALGKFTTVKLNAWMNAKEARDMPVVLFDRDMFSMQKVLFGGYTEKGVELRYLTDGREVKNLLHELKTNAAETNTI
ncbi:hypothetical protein [Gymnodinialimonas ulvae]|uniref:hypothetical protein n=1 Tax=Gymnodinialimonas ulvae TaxID=3126504 RepID=UPI0030ACB19C